MVKQAKKLGVWAGIISVTAVFGMFVGILITYISMSMDSLDQPLHSYYNLNDPLGKRFYQLSQSNSTDDNKLLIVPSSIGEEALKGMLSSDGWDIADRRWHKPENAEEAKAKYMNNVAAMARPQSIGNGTFCDIYMFDATRVDDYHRLLNNSWKSSREAALYAVFSHEMGHCLHKQFDYHERLVPTERVLERALTSFVNLDFKSEAVQWTNQWLDESLSEMHQRYLQEAFADVYAYAHMTYEKGYGAQRAHDLITKKRVRRYGHPGRAVYFSAPFVGVAHANRDKIGNFSSPAMFANDIMWRAMYTKPSFFAANLVANLVMSGQLDMSQVKNKTRINATIKSVRYYY